MTANKTKTRKKSYARTTGAGEVLSLQRLSALSLAGKGKQKDQVRITMPGKSSALENEYFCAIEKSQNGKYNVRIRAVFGRTGWLLPVYFLASSFDAAMKKLEESLQTLQKSEESLRFWAVERSDDPNLAGDLLQEYGLWLDRRSEFPRKAAEIGIPSERPVPASVLGPVRRALADAVASDRSRAASASASD
ncbi:MAG TPA: hypothetical protein VMU43_12285 [Candidatus Acidoferrum sp.]|nr:hypothetical protein [Candidatus Acidoferrum sp.]